jgi:molybdopterin synthase catalytic subunit
MRWIVTMVAVAAGVWYVRNRQRGGQVQQTVQDEAPPFAPGRVQSVATTMATAARQAVSAVQTRASGGATRVPAAPDRSEGPTTDMEQPPTRDHTDTLGRTRGAYVGNTKTRIVHRADSDHLPAEDHRVYFASAAEARDAAFEPAQNEGLETTDS